jgi:anti-sigma F factor antagonist
MVYEVANGVLIYYLPEELDHYAADMLKRKTAHVFDEEEIRYLIFDFSKTQFMDSSGIGLITGRFRMVHDKGGCVYAVHVNETIDRILLMSGIYRILKKMDSLDAIKKEMVKVYIADAIGSIIAEKTADCMEIALDEYIRDRGWRHTNRFSPGYCGWHVSEQKKLFPLFPSAEPCGIRLTDSSLMLPIKSVSGVIGLGEDVRKLEYTCGLCTYDRCYRRKQRG